MHCPLRNHRRQSDLLRVSRKRTLRKTILLAASLASAALLGQATFSGAAGAPEPAADSRSQGMVIRGRLGLMAKDGLNPANQDDFVTSTAAAFINGEIVVTARVRSSVSALTVVDIEIYQPNGARVNQQWFDHTPFAAGQEREFTIRWAPPPGAPRGTYLIKLGVFEPGREWFVLYHWKDAAATVILP